MARTKFSELGNRAIKGGKKKVRTPAKLTKLTKLTKGVAALGKVARKKPRFKWNVTARRAIRRAQKGVDMLIQKAPFRRDVRTTVEGSPNAPDGVKFTEGAMAAMMEATQQHLISHLSAAQLLAVHAKRMTVMSKDFELYANYLKDHSGATGPVRN